VLSAAEIAQIRRQAEEARAEAQRQTELARHLLRLAAEEGRRSWPSISRSAPDRNLAKDP
jgi:hypothetical protein